MKFILRSTLRRVKKLTVRCLVVAALSLLLTLNLYIILVTLRPKAPPLLPPYQTQHYPHTQGHKPGQGKEREEEDQLVNESRVMEQLFGSDFHHSNGKESNKNTVEQRPITNSSSVQSSNDEKDWLNKTSVMDQQFVSNVNHSTTKEFSDGHEKQVTITNSSSVQFSNTRKDWLNETRVLDNQFVSKVDISISKTFRKEYENQRPVTNRSVPISNDTNDSKAYQVKITPEMNAHELPPTFIPNHPDNSPLDHPPTPPPPIFISDPPVISPLNQSPPVPPTFIPDQPDTSPLGRPPDIPKRFLIEEADYCHKRPGLQIIAYVHSSIDRVSQRNLTRTTWATASAYDMGQNSVNIGVVFMVGRAKNSHERHIVQEESQRYHDIVQGDYGDHYRLLTYKGLAALYWISRHCAHVPWTLHSDDDTHIDIFLYHRALQELDDKAKKMFICRYIYSPVFRRGRWRVRHKEYQAERYPLYCSGGVWFLQTKLVPQLLEASKSVNFLWVDDAYVTGLLAVKAGIRHFSFHKYYGDSKPKLERLGREAVWFVKSVPRWVWWKEIVKYHRNLFTQNPATPNSKNDDLRYNNSVGIETVYSSFR